MDAKEKQRREWIKTLKPNTVVWEITLACNMRCIHCGSSASPLTMRKDELSTAEAVDVVKQLAGIGVQRVVLSGGEPFIRKDWYTLAQAIDDHGMVPSFISNGFMINEDKADKIKQLKNPNTHIGISVDGDQKVHDYIRQTKGSFKRVAEAMAILRDKGVLFSAITQVNRLNFKILPKIRDFIFKNGVYAWQVQLATPWGRLSGKNRNLLLTPKEYLALVNFIAEQRTIMGPVVVGADDMGYYTHLEENLSPGTGWNGCHAGIRTLGLTSNGGVTGCLSLQSRQFIEGNVRKRKLADIWFDPKLFAYNRDFKESSLKGYCKECIHRLQCRAGCKNIGCSFSGSPGENYYCVYRVMMGKSPAKVKLPKVLVGSHQFHP
jgi:radical SAM protein with 4Fe4S-binding SPASM domain